MARKQTPASSGTAVPYPVGFEPFIVAMQAAVDDDTPRLVFADWLEERGDPDRAEFIRLQCQFTRWDRGTQDTRYLVGFVKTTAAEKRIVRRLGELYASNRTRWLAGLPADDHDFHRDWPRFQRGFVGRFSRSPEELAGDAWAALRRITPVESVWVSEMNGNECAVLRTHALTGVRGLCLSSAAESAVAALAESPALLSLRWLRLFGGELADCAAFRSLFQSPALAGLRELVIGRFLPGDAAATALAESASLRELRSMGLIGTRLTPAGLERLASAPVFGPITSLDLSRSAVGDDGVRALVGSSLVRKLQNLDLSHCELGPVAARLLAGWKGLRSVRSLKLTGNPLGAEGLRALGESPCATGLTAIDLPTDPMPQAEWRAIERLPVFARIKDADPSALRGGPPSAEAVPRDSEP